MYTVVMENMMEHKNTKLEQAQKIAGEIKNEFNELFTEAKEKIESNELLKNAIASDGGLTMMLNEGFTFNAFRSGAVNSKEKIMAYDNFPLDGYLQANAEKINLENLNSLLSSFRERKAEILEALSTEVQSKDEAEALSQKIHTDLVIKTIETEPIFG